MSNLALLLVHIFKDSATEISKEVTRDQAADLATRFPVKVSTPDGMVDWADFTAAEEKAAAEQAVAVQASLLKRQGLKKADFLKLDDATRETMLLEETALMAVEADAAAKAGA